MSERDRRVKVFRIELRSLQRILAGEMRDESAWIKNAQQLKEIGL